MSLDIIDKFDRARDEAAYKEFEHERLVHNIAQADGVGEFNNAGVIDGAAGMVRELRLAEQEAERRNKDNVETQVLLASMRLEAFEDSLEAQYGEDFAENMFADLYEEGKIDEEEYKRIMAIEDKDERRKAIARAVQDGIDSGKIDPDTMKEHPWVKDWLDLHEQKRVAVEAKAEMMVENNAIALDAGDSALDKAADMAQTESLSQNILENDKATGNMAQATDAGFTFGIPG